MLPRTKFLRKFWRYRKSCCHRPFRTLLFLLFFWIWNISCGWHFSDKFWCRKFFWFSVFWVVNHLWKSISEWIKFCSDAGQLDQVYLYFATPGWWMGSTFLEKVLGGLGLWGFLWDKPAKNWHIIINFKKSSKMIQKHFAVSSSFAFVVVIFLKKMFVPPPTTTGILHQPGGVGNPTPGA